MTSWAPSKHMGIEHLKYHTPHGERHWKIMSLTQDARCMHCTSRLSSSLSLLEKLTDWP